MWSQASLMYEGSSCRSWMTKKNSSRKKTISWRIPRSWLRSRRARMPTDVSEKGLEALIVASLIDDAGYIVGDPRGFDREHAVDATKLMAFLKATQPETVERLGIGETGPNREKFL